MGIFAEDLIENSYGYNDDSDIEMCSNCGELVKSKYLRFENGHTVCYHCE